MGITFEAPGAEVVHQEFAIGEFELSTLRMASPRSTLTIHIIEANDSLRASTFRMLKGLGYHCEIYATVAELIEFRPTSGIVLKHEYRGGNTVAGVAARLRSAGIFLNIAGCSEEPEVRAVVNAMRAGALDYLAMPFDTQQLSEVLESLADVNEAQCRENHEKAEATARLARLSGREREVLELVAKGASNKEAARKLDISPRTVEIHRMKMMGKLGVASAAQAVRFWLMTKSSHA